MPWFWYYVSVVTMTSPNLATDVLDLWMTMISTQAVELRKITSSRYQLVWGGTVYLVPCQLSH